MFILLYRPVLSMELKIMKLPLLLVSTVRSAKVYSTDQHAMIPDVMVMSSKVWKNISPEDQQIILEQLVNPQKAIKLPGTVRFSRRSKKLKLQWVLNLSMM